MTRVFVETAEKAMERWGKRLIGKKVFTQEIGEWPGGWATVTEIEPDPAAPEIVFQVKHPIHGSVGVFKYEQVLTEEERKGSAAVQGGR